MNRKHAEAKLKVIHAVLGMAIEDAYTFVECNDETLDPEGFKEAVKQYNRAVRAREYFYQLFTKPCSSNGCGGGCSGCKCGGDEEV